MHSFKTQLHLLFQAYDRMPLHLRAIIMLGFVALLLGIPGTVSYIASQNQIKSLTRITPTASPTKTESETTITLSPTEEQKTVSPTKTASVTPKTTITPTNTPTAGPTNTPVPATPTPVSLVIHSISPSSGPIMTSVTVTGKGFGSEKGDLVFCPNQCDSGAPIDSWTDTEIKAKVPGLITIAKTMDVFVFTKKRESSNKVQFTVTAGQPVIDSPQSGGVGSPGQELVIKGFNFGTSGKFEFFKVDGNHEKVADAGVISWSDKELRLTIPSNLTSGSEYGVAVTSNGGAQSSYKYYRIQ